MKKYSHYHSPVAVTFHHQSDENSQVFINNSFRYCCMLKHWYLVSRKPFLPAMHVKAESTVG